jgi:hypothetical protein
LIYCDTKISSPLTSTEQQDSGYAGQVALEVFEDERRIRHHHAPKTADLQAHNASQMRRVVCFRSAVFSTHHMTKYDSGNTESLNELEEEATVTKIISQVIHAIYY